MTTFPLIGLLLAGLVSSVAFTSRTTTSRTNHHGIVTRNHPRIVRSSSPPLHDITSIASSGAEGAVRIIFVAYLGVSIAATINYVFKRFVLKEV